MPKTSAPPTFDPDTYAKITLNDLVMYSTYFLHQQGSEITSEDIISACFLLFPRRFALRKHPHWPDSGMVTRHRSLCKGKGYLRGSANTGFQITAKGIRRAEKVEKSLGKLRKPIPKTKKPVVPISSTPAGTIHPELKAYARKYVRSIEMSDAYKHYKKRTPLNEFDFRSLLLCTMESPPATIARNLEQFKEYVNIQDRKDLSSFLEFCGEKFSYLLDTTTKPVGSKATMTKK
ncbi:MAG TPA: hypothetical protein VFR47_25850 [Anaerolineales bacterium]|nr:hypothetical protein [Anaerolineales bacterium]